MTIVTWLLAGGLTGWTASYFLGHMHSQAIAFNIAVAVVGSVLAGWIVAPLLDVGVGFSVGALIVSGFGAAASLFCIHVVQRTVSR
jgi:uncharacterized membrane protein YeaQ/YmgE (transglycosylase-associated protein family)